MTFYLCLTTLLIYICPLENTLNFFFYDKYRRTESFVLKLRFVKFGINIYTIEGNLLFQIIRTGRDSPS